MKGRPRVTFSTPPEQQDYNDFLKEFTKETDRGAALASAALIDEWLANTLRAFFADGESAKWLLKPGGPLYTLKSRTEAAFALRLIDKEEHRNIELIRKIRNEFAHSWKSLSFELDPIQSYCQKLSKTAPAIVSDKKKSNNRVIFVYTVWDLLNQSSYTDPS